jgi:hypothetical protein
MTAGWGLGELEGEQHELKARLNTEERIDRRVAKVQSDLPKA